MKPQEPLKVVGFAWVWVGLVDGVKWCHGTATQGLGSNRSLVNKMPCFLQTLTGNVFVWTWFWLQNSILCTVGPIGDFPFLVSNSWCVHPSSSFSSSATRLGGCDLAYLVEHADPTLNFMHFWWDRFHWFDRLHFACWLVSVRSFDVMLWFLDVEIGGKRQRKVRGIAFKHIQASCDFWNRTDERINLLSYSMSWASPSLPRHDVRIKRPSFMSFMEVRATVDCSSSAWVIQKWDLLTMFGLRILGFWHGLSFRQPSLKDSASALRRFRLDCCWATNPGPPACAGNTWEWSWLRWPGTDENWCIKLTLKFLWMSSIV